MFTLSKQSLNSELIQETIEVFEHENDIITKAAQTLASLTSVMTTMVRNQFEK